VQADERDFVAVETRFEIPVHSLGVIFGVLFISIITLIIMGKKGDNTDVA